MVVTPTILGMREDLHGGSCTLRNPYIRSQERDQEGRGRSSKKSRSLVLLQKKEKPLLLPVKKPVIGWSVEDKIHLPSYTEKPSI